MRYAQTATTSAPVQRLWAAVIDVERWPEWMETYESVRRNQPGPLRPGHTAHVKQKGLAGGDWTVTEFDEGSVFSWENVKPGVRFVGRHAVAAEPSGGSRVMLSFEASGPLSGLVRLFYGRKVRAYLDIEAARLAAAAVKVA
ncbi:SRPBCC family protein [Nocardioides agariphilus]|jgi:uncharacterized membrane protein|uniref:SRPBCC family protein n=1 Tax=Nocardioides agariphilus TaxID=433664 RepID=A0A930YHH7_9ACTN|nr:SRPBCC family protein [Nocardioides agariphilus]MBF4767127.1 SRPBCC family protein [Nocardioides agariphilus]